MAKEPDFGGSISLLQAVWVGKSADLTRAAEGPAVEHLAHLVSSILPSCCALCGLWVTCRNRHLGASLIYFAVKQMHQKLSCCSISAILLGPAQKVLPGRAFFDLLTLKARRISFSSEFLRLWFPTPPHLC